MEGILLAYQTTLQILLGRVQVPESQLLPHADSAKGSQAGRVGIDEEGKEIRLPYQSRSMEDFSLCLLPDDPGRSPPAHGSLHTLVVAEHDHPAFAILADKIGRGDQEAGGFARSRQGAEKDANRGGCWVTNDSIAGRTAGARWA